ncbi:MAG: hypothetical protein ACKVU1_13355, partial [bacterium]
MKKPRAKSKRDGAKKPKLRAGRRLGGANDPRERIVRDGASGAAHFDESERLDRGVIDFVRRANGEPISIGEIAEGLGFERHQAPELRIVVKRLIREGRLEAARGAGLRIPADGGARGHGRRSHGPPQEGAAPAKPPGRGARQRGDV